MGRPAPPRSRPFLRGFARVVRFVREPFDRQQRSLAIESTGVATEATAGVQDPMAGDDDRQRVGAERISRPLGRPADSRLGSRPACSSRSPRTGSGWSPAAPARANPACVIRQSIGVSNERRRPAKNSSSSRRGASSRAGSRQHSGRDPLGQRSQHLILVVRRHRGRRRGRGHAGSRRAAAARRASARSCTRRRAVPRRRTPRSDQADRSSRTSRRSRFRPSWTFRRAASSLIPIVCAINA